MVMLSFFFLGFLMLLNYTSARAVSFKTSVNTQSRPIKHQIKKMFKLEGLGWYANNKFNGAGLNRFKTLRQGSAKAIIAPENNLIKQGVYYAFKVWPSAPNPLYIIPYLDSYKQLCIPKLHQDNFWRILHLRLVLGLGFHSTNKNICDSNNTRESIVFQNFIKNGLLKKTF